MDERCGEGLSVSASAKNIILMVSDGLGYNGWLASDYYWQGAAGKQVYQRPRPDGTAPFHLARATGSLGFVDARGWPLRHDGSPLPEGAVGTTELRYDPATRWRALANSFRNDFAPVSLPYTSYTDSAAAATALLSGRLTTNGRLNRSWDDSSPFETIAQRAHARGKATGVVTSVYASHATPAAVWAHNASRENYEAVFNEMLSGGLDVVMGCGHPDFDDSGNFVVGTKEYRYVGGEDNWRALRKGTVNGFSLIGTRAQFRALAAGRLTLDKVVGIAQAGSTLQARRRGLANDACTPSGMALNRRVPDLATMSLGALRVLGRHPNGFFLLIEGGAVDWANHDNDLTRMLEEQRDFDRAAEAVVAWVERYSNWQETLLIVTADHETGGLWGEGAFYKGTEDAKSLRFDPVRHGSGAFRRMQNLGRGVLPKHQYATANHTNELVPLWVLGVGSRLLAARTSTDPTAAQLWGEPYAWDGRFVEATEVFGVMSAVLERSVQTLLARYMTKHSGPTSALDNGRTQLADGEG